MTTYETTKQEYLNALEAARVASAKFREITEAYRARKIGDSEFLAARAEHKAAQDKFDYAQWSLSEAALDELN